MSISDDETVGEHASRLLKAGGRALEGLQTTRALSRSKWNSVGKILASEVPTRTIVEKVKKFAEEKFGHSR